MGVRRIGRVAVISVFVVLLLVASAEASPTARITRVSTNAEGTLGSFAGFVTHDGSGCTDPCHWRGLLTIQPWTIQPPLYPCKGENWTHDGSPLVRVIWDSLDQTVFPSTVAFDRQDFPILSGIEDQRLCLYIVYTSPPELENNYQCAPADPYCPPGVTQEEFTVGHQQTFSVQTSPPGGGGSGGGSGGGGGGAGGGSGTSPPVSKQPEPVATLSKTLALSRAKAALSRKYRRAYKRGKKRLSCERRSSKEYRCKFNLRYRKKKWRGTVTVRATAEGIKASVKSSR
jgi:uncharacterized membrane protein YgcG